MRKILSPKTAHHCAELAYIAHESIHANGTVMLVILITLGITELVVWLVGEH